MSEHVYWMIEADVNDGKLDELKSLMAEMSDATLSNEPGALNYEWSLSEDEKAVHIFERYKDSAATLTHMANVNANFGARFMGAIKMKKWTLYGSPDETVQKALSPMGAIVMTSVAGFSR